MFVFCQLCYFPKGIFSLSSYSFLFFFNCGNTGLQYYINFKCTSLYFNSRVDYIIFTTQKLIIVHLLTWEPTHPFHRWFLNNAQRLQLMLLERHAHFSFFTLPMAKLWTIENNAQSLLSCDQRGKRRAHSPDPLSLWYSMATCTWSWDAGKFYPLPSSKQGRPGNLRASELWLSVMEEGRHW